MAKVFIEETTLTAIGDAIRGKEGTTELIPVPDMAARISAIEGGGSGGGGSDIGLTAEDFTFKGDLSNFNAGGAFDNIFNKKRDLLTFTDVTCLDNAFANSKFDFGNLPMNLAGGTSGNSSAGMGSPFRYYAGTSLPKLTGKWGSLGMIQFYFGDQKYITSYDGVFDNVDWSWLDENIQKSTYNCVRDLCQNNFRMRKAIPPSVLKHWDSTNTWGNIYLYSYDYCYSLDELTDLPVFNNQYCRVQLSLRYCERLKKFTFETNPDGSPIVADQWAYNSIIDFSTCGSGSSASGYIDGAKKIYNYTDYTNYKDDENACAIYAQYSRYNRASAVETINSLPDVSGATGYTHTIKFKGEAGSETDSGAINTLTAEEIAVATAKGWTITLV